ncbi:ATP synthase subunit delta, chloroplastic [Sesamum alatum]|uniref:ATP synthase subunit delta, chloroplastic n=1 Tax=Sesamum alatum TaxID=300844 RepID=A0AAE1XVT9_9LAMI|nr:ATP synthase subunit delta, chloroplastic [Sesamum alatum]
MDTLSGSVSSTFNIPSLHPKSHHFKNHLPHLIASTSTSTPKPSKVSSNKATIFTAHNNFINPPLVNSSQSALPLKQSSKQQQQPESHHKASTGYAVALLDVARCNNVVQVVERDVKRLSKLLCNDQLSAIVVNPCVEKGEILKEIVKKGKFHKYLVKLVKLLVEKSKVEMLSEVLMEFGRIYDDLSGSSSANSTTQVVFVSSGSGVKIEEKQLLGIARTIQKLSGAASVKVRQLVGRTQFPSISFAP